MTFEKRTIPMERAKKLGILLFLLLGGLSFSLKGQQLPQYTQYMFNKYYLNPAYAGSKAENFASIGYRSQWAGFSGPTTAIASFHAPFKEQVGLGGLMMHDVSGPFQKTGLQLSYAYHFDIDKDVKLGLSLAGRLFQHKLDRNQLEPDVADDPALRKGRYRSVDPDADFGAYLQGDRYWAGLSVPQLFQSRILGDSLANTHLSRHYFLHGGYRFQLNDEFEVEPSALFKATQGAPLSMDINAKLYYDEFLWGGFSYRLQESFSVLLGVRKEQFRLGYSYDMTFNPIRNYSSGSHGIHLAMVIPSGKEMSLPSF